MDPKKMIGASKWTLDTPCLVVDEDILDRNIRTMQSFMTSHGKQLRPHAKTHKCTRIARKQTEAGCRGICVAKVSEAEVLAQNGFRGTLITSPVVGERKIERLITSLENDPGMMIVVDNEANAETLNAAASSSKKKLSVLVDLDPGMGRTGVPFDQGVALARKIESLPSLALKGIQCYAGSVQHIASFGERQEASLGWLKKAAQVFRDFKNSGLPTEVFTGSGTGTFDIDVRVPELTDLQTGSYTLMDSEYLNIGSAENPARFEKFPPALTLLTTVISCSHPDFVTVDAGLKSLYHHGGDPAVILPGEPNLKYEWRGDEHGKVSGFRKKLELGQVLEVVVSHCDPTVNLFDVFYVTRKGIVTDVWPIDMRGKSQ
ncbi:MAG TPA: DSD1 family PLP-dependent enzyme [Thermodesulfobacteriota bacterium]|nr:DSD1 family PLP-dependent enzyme [Thermodesulfobacteriota bacterium]